MINVEGLRPFGGHTTRVSDAQTFSALGIEANTIKILARRFGDTILRYEAPLRSLRADLGLGDFKAFGPSPNLARTPMGTAKESKAFVARLKTLERNMNKFEAEVQSQAQDVVAMAIAYDRADRRIYI